MYRSSIWVRAAFASDALRALGELNDRTRFLTPMFRQHFFSASLHSNQFTDLIKRVRRRHFYVEEIISGSSVTAMRWRVNGTLAPAPRTLWIFFIIRSLSDGCRLWLNQFTSVDGIINKTMNKRELSEHFKGQFRRQPFGMPKCSPSNWILID